MATALSAIDRSIDAIEPHTMARAAMSLADAQDEEMASNSIKDSFNYDLADPRAVQVPYSKDEFAKQQQRDPRLRKLLRVGARAVVGLGWELESKTNSEESPRPATAEEQLERGRIAALLESINPEAAFGEVCESVELDRRATGDGYLEVVRGFGPSDNEDEAAMGLGPVRRVFHVPGPTVRILNDDSGYVQRRTHWPAHKKVYFKKFGEPRVMNKHTGEWEDDTLPREDRATELIHFRNFDPGSDWYGTPEFLAASNYLGLGLISTMRLFNLIRNSPGWAFAMKVNGLHSEQWSKVKGDIDANNKGLFSAGGVLKVNLPRAPGARAGMGDGSAMQTLGSWMGEVEPLVKVLEVAREVVREVFGFSEVYLGGASALSRNGAREARQITNEMEFEPLVRRFEGTINATLMRSWGAQHVRFSVRRPKATDAAQESQILARLGGLGAYSINQILQQANRLLPDANFRLSEDPMCNVPLVLLREVGAQAKPESAKAVEEAFSAMSEKLERLAEKLATA